MAWLRKTYDEFVGVGSYEDVTRAYMLHIITCTLFVDKSDVYINARYMCLFSRLEDTSWAWTCAALTLLYTTLGVVIVFETKQLADYWVCYRYTWNYYLLLISYLIVIDSIYHVLCLYFDINTGYTNIYLTYVTWVCSISLWGPHGRRDGRSDKHIPVVLLSTGEGSMRWL